MSQAPPSKTVAIKLLLSHNLTGSLIGLGGKSIKELIEITGAKVHVSSNTEPYPGTPERVVMISGEIDAVTLAQTLVWEMIALVTSAENPKEVEWNPKDMLNYLGQNDSAEVTGKVTIPAAAGGLILGKGGANIQSIAELSGASVNMTSKEDALFTHERIITITGTVGSCIKCTGLILRKLDEPEESIPYVNRGTTYSSPVSAGNPFGIPYSNNAYGAYGGGMMPYGGAQSHHQGFRRGGSQFRGGSGGAVGGSIGGVGHPQQQQHFSHPQHGASELDAVGMPTETTITFTVPDELVGNIFGRQVRILLTFFIFIFIFLKPIL